MKKNKTAPTPPKKPTRDVLADDVASLADDLAYRVTECETAGVTLPADLAVRVDSFLCDASAELTDITDSIEALLPQPGRSAGGKPPTSTRRGTLPVFSGAGSSQA